MNAGRPTSPWRIRSTLAACAVASLTLVGCTEANQGPDAIGGRAPDQNSSDAVLGVDGDETEDSFEPQAAPRDEPTYPTPIRVDQFGYRPADRKVAVVADPEVGFDSDFEVNVGPFLEVRRVIDDRTVLSGPPVPWADGSLHEQSGDRGWWFDFSTLETPGSYYVVDPEQGNRSGPFVIGDDVYNVVLDTALRMFWYNRGNIEHSPNLSGPWTDGAAYVGPGQDTEARSVDTPDDPGSARDLSGGWFDAGDPNKYVTFATEPVHVLLSSYARRPELFHDDLGIPESGNGVPDVLDEVRWELDWLGKMQLDDGSVLTKVGLLGFEIPLVPSAASEPRYYEEACSSSTIAAAGMFAHGALVLDDISGLADESAELRDRAIRAWNRYQAMERRDDCDPQEVKAGDADLSIEEQASFEVVAAVYLFALTGEAVYRSAVTAGYERTQPFQGEGFGSYRPEQADALLFYRGLPGADPDVVTAIDERVADLVTWSPLFGFDAEADLYRAYVPDSMYHWGSNRGKGNAGADNLLVGPIDGGRERALGHLHYFHGVNPLGLVYLSNMGDFGAEHSAQFLFHHWFGDGSAYDVNEVPEPGVAPGYVVGGPNASYTGTESPPAGQPAQKSYEDWAAYGTEPSWEITEPSITYQAGYIRLLTAVLAS